MRRRRFGAHLAMLLAVAAPAVSEDVARVEAGATDQEFVIRVGNPDSDPMEGITVALEGSARYLEGVRIEPERVELLESGESIEFSVRFDVAKDAPDGATETLVFVVDAEWGWFEEPTPQLTIEIAGAERRTGGQAKLIPCTFGADYAGSVYEHSACDPALQPLYSTDTVWLFYEPSVGAQETFRWRLLDAQDEVVNHDEHRPGETDDGDSTQNFERTEEGAPASLALYTPALKAGLYRLQIQTDFCSGTGVAYGQGCGDETREGPWKEEGSFQVEPAILHFQGFVAEPRIQWASEKQDVLDLSPVFSGESQVDLELVARWESGGERGRGRTQLALDFPQQLVLGNVHEGNVVGVYLKEVEAATNLDGRWGFGIKFDGIGPSDQPKSFEEVKDAVAYSSSFKWIGDFHEESSSPDAAGDASDDTFLPLPKVEGPSKQTRLLFDTDRFHDYPLGQPEKAQARHYRTEGETWYFPVEIYFTHFPDDYYPRDRSLVGFAVYKTQPGTYDGPFPRAGDVADAGPGGEGVGDSAAGTETVAPDAGDIADVSPAGGGSPAAGTTGNPTGGGARTAGGDPAGGGPPVAGAAGNPTGGDVPGGTPVAPGAVNPADPDVARLIRTWLRVAEPPENADGANFHYDAWGRYIGSAAPGAGQTVGQAPPPDGGRSPETFAWSMAGALDSIDHCTLEEFVTLLLRNAPIDHCNGRYAGTPKVAAPVLAGLSLGEAQLSLATAGLKMLPSLLGNAPTPELANRIAAQRPDAASPVPTGSTVDVDVYGSYAAPQVTVPLLRGMTLELVQTAAEGLGLVLQPVLIGTAPSAELAFQATSQFPTAGTQVEVGSTLTVEVYGNYAPPATAQVTVPLLTGMTLELVQTAAEGLGLELQPVLIGAAPSAELAFQARSQFPTAGTQVEVGSTLTIDVYGNYAPPATAAVIRERASLDRRKEADCEFLYSQIQIFRGSPDAASRGRAVERRREATTKGCDSERIAEAFGGPDIGPNVGPDAAWDLNGEWMCTKRCPAGGEGKSAHIAQTGTTLRFTNEGGDTSDGHFEGKDSIVSIGWGKLKGSVRDGGRAIHWANGTIWRRPER